MDDVDQSNDSKLYELKCKFALAMDSCGGQFNDVCAAVIKRSFSKPTSLGGEEQSLDTSTQPHICSTLYDMARQFWELKKIIFDAYLVRINDNVIIRQVCTKGLARHWFLVAHIYSTSTPPTRRRLRQNFDNKQHDKLDYHWRALIHLLLNLINCALDYSFQWWKKVVNMIFFLRIWQQLMCAYIALLAQSRRCSTIEWWPVLITPVSQRNRSNQCSLKRCKWRPCALLGNRWSSPFMTQQHVACDHIVSNLGMTPSAKNVESPLWLPLSPIQIHWNTSAQRSVKLT